MGKALEKLKQTNEALAKSEVPLRSLLNKAMKPPRPTADAHVEHRPDSAIRGVHQPLAPGSVHSKAGILAAGAKPGSPDARAALKEHRAVLSQMKSIKPTLKSEGCLEPGMSYGSLQKMEMAAKSAGNPDETADAKLGETIENVVENHMLANKEAEKQEGHPSMQKATTGPDGARAMETGHERGVATQSKVINRPGASSMRLKSLAHQRQLSVGRMMESEKIKPKLGKGVDDMFMMSMKPGQSYRDLKKATLGMEHEQFDEAGALKPQEISLDAEAARRPGEADKEDEALQRQKKVEGMRAAAQSATVKDGAEGRLDKDDDMGEVSEPIEPMAMSLGKGMSYRDLKKMDQKLASKDIAHNMRHLDSFPGGRKQAIAAGLNEARAGKDVTKSEGRPAALVPFSRHADPHGLSAIAAALNTFSGRLGQPAMIREAPRPQAAERPAPAPLVPLAKTSPTAQDLTALGRRRLVNETAAEHSGPHGQSYNSYRADNGE